MLTRHRRRNSIRRLSRRVGRKNQIRRRRVLLERLEDRRLLAAIPNDPLFTSQWQLHNTGQTGGTYDADMDVLEAWSVSTGSMSTVVSINDSGVDYTHEDLYLNIWINEGEIPAPIAGGLTDADSDGVMSFRDLNDPSNASYVTDLNGTGYIDGGDLLADPDWEDGFDTDGNGYIDDLIGWDFFEGDNDPMDLRGHGTGIASQIGAMGNNGVGLAGINLNVRLMPMRITNLGDDWTIASGTGAIDYAVEMGAPISNNSWGGRCNGAGCNFLQYSQEMYDALDRARLAGHLFVTASGNSPIDWDEAEPFSWLQYDLDNIFYGVGIDENNEMFGHGFGGETMHVSVPTRDSAQAALGNQYAYGGGSSSTVPMLAGVAALVHSVHPEWGHTEIMAQIMSTVDQVPGLAELSISGGRVNAAAAVGLVETELFSDSFENGQWNGLWVEDSQNDWFTSSQRETDGNASAEVDGRATDATLTVANSIDLSSSLSAELTFDWYIETGWDTGEHLELELFDGSSWTVVRTLDGNVREGSWESETVQIDSDYLLSDFKFRFSAKVSSSREDGNVDNVRLTALSLPAPPSLPSLSINDVQLAEGDNGTTNFEFTVTRSGDTSGTSSVDFTTADATAIAGSDYLTNSGTLQFLAGETSKTVSVDVIGDTDIEPDETFLVSLSNPSGATIDVVQGQGTIANDDVGNQPPTVMAGPDQAASDDDGSGVETVTLVGSGSDSDGSISSYAWTEGAKVHGNSPSISPTLTVGVHTLTLTVTDNEGASGSDTVVVTVNANQAPTADAGPDQTVSDGDGGGDQVATINGVGLDTDGTITTYQWMNGATDLGTTASIAPTLAVGTHTLTLTVTDNGGASGSDSVVVTVNANQAPSADAGSDQNVIDADASGDETVTLTGSGSDTDGNIVTYQWTEGTTVRGNTAIISPPLSVGAHTLTLTVTDNGGASSSDDVVVTVNAQPVSSTKFYVVDDSADDMFEYQADGSFETNYNLGSGNNSPRGAAATVVGDTLWVIDNDDHVYVHDDAGNLLREWKANGLNRPEGIATDGTDVWIVDRGTDRVYYFAGGATRTSDTGATSSFALDTGGGNKSSKGITYGAIGGAEYLWVVDAARNVDKVFRYSIAGSPAGNWTIDGDNSSPKGITIDPSGVNDIWIVDSSDDAVYQYSGGATRTSGSQSSDAAFNLATGNTNPQGIADPPAETTVTAVAIPAVGVAFVPVSKQRSDADRDESAFKLPKTSPLVVQKRAAKYSTAVDVAIKEMVTTRAEHADGEEARSASLEEVIEELVLVL